MMSHLLALHILLALNVFFIGCFILVSGQTIKCTSFSFNGFPVEAPKTDNDRQLMVFLRKSPRDYSLKVHCQKGPQDVEVIMTKDDQNYSYNDPKTPMQVGLAQSSNALDITLQPKRHPFEWHSLDGYYQFRTSHEKSSTFAGIKILVPEKSKYLDPKFTHWLMEDHFVAYSEIIKISCYPFTLSPKKPFHFEKFIGQKFYSKDEIDRMEPSKRTLAMQAFASGKVSITEKSMFLTIRRPETIHSGMYRCYSRFAPEVEYHAVTIFPPTSCHIFVEPSDSFKTISARQSGNIGNGAIFVVENDCLSQMANSNWTMTVAMKCRLGKETPNMCDTGRLCSPVVKRIALASNWSDTTGSRGSSTKVLSIDGSRFIGVKFKLHFQPSATDNEYAVAVFFHDPQPYELTKEALQQTLTTFTLRRTDDMTKFCGFSRIEAKGLDQCHIVIDDEFAIPGVKHIHFTIPDLTQVTITYACYVSCEVPKVYYCESKKRKSSRRFCMPGTALLIGQRDSYWLTEEFQSISPKVASALQQHKVSLTNDEFMPQLVNVTLNLFRNASSYTKAVNHFNEETRLESMSTSFGVHFNYLIKKNQYQQPPSIPVVYTHFVKANSSNAIAVNRFSDDTENVWFHNFKEGMTDVTLSCRHLENLPEQQSRKAAWQVFNKTTRIFDNIADQQWGPDKTSRLGLYLYFGEQGLKVQQSGIFRCISERISEYHKIAIFMPTRCKILVNGTTIKTTLDVYRVTWQVPLNFPPSILDFSCDVGNRHFEVDSDSGALVNPVVQFLFNNQVLSDKSSTSTSVHEKRFIHARYSLPHSTSGGNASIFMTFIPVPSGNNLEVISSEMLTSIKFLNYQPSVAKLITQELLLKPWKRNPAVGMKGLKNMTDYVELLIDPGVSLDFFVQYDLSYGRFCDLIRWRQCFPTKVTLLSRATGRAEQKHELKLSYFPPLHTVEIENILKFSAVLDSDSRLRITLNISGMTRDVYNYASLVAALYLLELSIGDKAIGSSDVFLVSLDLRVASSMFRLKQPSTPELAELDCYLANKYIGIDSTSGCSKSTCITHDLAEPYCQMEAGDVAPWCFVATGPGGKLLKEMCDIPHCFAFFPYHNRNYDRFAGACSKCGNQTLGSPIKIRGSRQKMIGDCLTMCDAHEQCSGFELDLELRTCLFYKFPCSCQFPLDCSKMIYYFRKILKTPKAAQLWSIEKGVSRIEVVDIEEGSRIHGAKDIALNRNINVTSCKFYYIERNKIQQNPTGMDLPDITVVDERLRGYAIIKQPPLSVQYTFIKVLKKPRCTVRHNPHDVTVVNKYDIQVKLKSNNRNPVSIACDVDDRSVGYCPDNGLGGHLAICNPWIRVTRKSGKHTRMYMSSACYNDRCDTLFPYATVYVQATYDTTLNQIQIYIWNKRVKVSDSENEDVYYVQLNFFPVVES